MLLLVGMNHLDRKVQSAMPPPYPLPPPLCVVFLPHVTYRGVWVYLLLIGWVSVPNSSGMIVLGVDGRGWAMWAMWATPKMDDSLIVKTGGQIIL